MESGSFELLTLRNIGSVDVWEYSDAKVLKDKLVALVLRL